MMNKHDLVHSLLGQRRGFQETIRDLQVKVKSIDEAIKALCDHDWELEGTLRGTDFYSCKVCGLTKEVSKDHV